MTQNIQWTKQVCQLDEDRLYVGQTTADLDTYARDGSYLIPAGCIDTAPPQIPEGHVARWSGEGWEYIEDHRGKTAYRKADGHSVVLALIGKISDDLTLTAPPSGYCEWDGKKWVENEEKKAADEAALFFAAKNAILRSVARDAQAIINEQSGMDKLPEFEVQSWPIQAAEARAWAADKTADTPVLNQIAQARGSDPDELKAAALKKAIAYETLCATVAGRRQSIEKQVEAAKTIDELNDVDIEINL